MGQGAAVIRRRAILAGGISGAGVALSLSGCAKPDEIPGGFNGISHERGHLLRALPGTAPPAPAVVRRTSVLIAGGGVAGLAAARALRQRGIDDFALLELEDGAGGNSRAGAIAGIACPLGAHYLPVPGDAAHEVQDLLEELGLRRRVAGRWEYDERHLCHSPQERLYFNGQWQDGLLPLDGVPAGTLAQYRRFAALVAQAGRDAPFAIPAARAPFAPLHRALDAITFAAWLDREQLTDAHLRWYLDYCCQDDYGAGAGVVSAWAGLHYFASRHGFHAPGEAGGERDAVLTWPEGNAWLARRLAAPLGERVRAGQVVTRIAAGRHGVEVDAMNLRTRQPERWLAAQCIVALPLFVAARVVQNPPQALRDAAAQTRHAPWLVANLHLREPLRDRPGAAPAWDNLLYGARGLGYVDARHQSLDPTPGPTVLTWYRALGDLADGRAQLLARPWQHWRDEMLAELSIAHPDLRGKASRVEITRYGHAMAMPVPGARASAARLALQLPSAGGGASGGAGGGRLHFAHADLSGYSIFEEAFTHGHRAALQALASTGLS